VPNADTRTTTYTYNSLNRLTSLTEPIIAGNGSVPGTTRSYSFTYDANGNRTATIYPNGITQRYSYDALNRITKIDVVRTSDNAVLMDLATPRNLLGLKTYLTQSVLNNPGSSTYLVTYDNHNRLLSYGGQRFAYDNVGNKLQDTFPFSRSYQHNERDQVSAISASDGTYTLRYDASGNIKDITPGAGNFAIASNTPGPNSLATDKTTYRFDSLNRLTQVSLKAQTPASPTVAYQYDVMGNRIARIRAQVTPPTTPIAGSGNDLNPLYTGYSLDRQLAYAQVLEERSSNADGAYPVGLTGAQATGVGNLAISFTYDGSGAGGGNTTVASGITRLSEARNMAPGCTVVGNCVNTSTPNAVADYQTFFYHVDDQGSTRLITDAAGQVVAGYIYLANGEVYTKGVGPLYPAGHPTAYLYTGEHQDPETGLIYLRARYYSTVMGRFLPSSAVRGEKWAIFGIRVYINQ
jgi:RHS repeat-associated protein